MATYLCVKAGNQTKSYSVKSTANKPYMRVSTGYIPLTTETTTATGLRVKVGGSVCRPIETYTTTISVNTSSTNTYTYTVTQSQEASALITSLRLDYGFPYVITVSTKYNANYDVSFTNAARVQADRFWAEKMVPFSMSWEYKESTNGRMFVSSTSYIQNNSLMSFTVSHPAIAETVGLKISEVISVKYGSFTSKSISHGSQTVDFETTKSCDLETMTSLPSIDNYGLMYMTVIMTTFSRWQRPRTTQGTYYPPVTIINKTMSYSTVVLNDKTSTSYYTTESTVTSE